MPPNLRCEDVGAAFEGVPACENTDQGLRLITQCLYPSFDPVVIYVVRPHAGEGKLIVHDGGGAARSTWIHGREQQAATKAINQQAAIHHLSVVNETLRAEIDSEEWLSSAILAVANASAAAALDAAQSTQQAIENTLHDMIHRVLKSVVSEKFIGDGFNLRGRSGKEHRFDFGVREPSGSLTLIDAVAPHHVSIAAKYVAFSDTSSLNGAVRGRFIVHDRPLDNENVALLGQFADVVPSNAIRPRLTQHFAA